MKKALLVIDLQNDYFPGGKFPLWNTDAVLDNIEQAITTARPDSQGPQCHHAACWRREASLNSATRCADVAVSDRLQPHQGVHPTATGAISSRRDRSGWRGSSMQKATKHRIFTTSVASVYPLYVAKAERKGRTKDEVDAVIRWLTGYSQLELESQLREKKDFETFFREAPKPNPARALIKGLVCGVRVEDIVDPTMREIRYLDKLADELAKGKALDKILRT